MPPVAGIEIIARGFLQVGSKILLCRNRKQGYHYLTGGHVEPGEAAADACAREFREETGIEARAGEVMLVCEVIFADENGPKHEINLVFHVEHNAAASLDAEPLMASVTSQEPELEFVWVDQASIADLDLRPAAIKAWLMSGGALASENRPHWFSSRE